MTPAEIRILEVTAGHERGWSYLPLDGKKPIEKGWTERPRETLEQALAWAEAGNVGIRTGRASGLVVIDVDPGGNVDALNLPPTVTALTGRAGGRHLYYRSNGCAIPNSAGKLGEHIDIKSDRGQVVFVGSVHPESGQVYRWAPGAGPDEIGIATLPQAIINRLVDKQTKHTGGLRVVSNYGAAALRGEVEAVRAAREGGRNSRLNLAALRLGELVAAGVLDRDEVKTELHQAAFAAGLDGDEIEGTIESGLSSGEKQPRVIHVGDRTLRQQASLNTDVGNAARFAIREADKLRFCFERSTWLVWDGRRWAPDNAGTVVSLAKQTALSIFDEAKRADGDKSEELGKWAVKSQRRERLSAMVELAKPDLAIRASELDADPWLLTCSNGTVNLRSGELRPHHPGDYITRLAPVDYDPLATNDVWDGFLATVTDGDMETQTFLQRAAGYSATGLTTEEKLFFIHGHGATGKSSFIEAVKSALGDYAATADFETFLENRNTGPRNDVAALDGARLVASVEVSDGRHLAQGLVKMLTGGDTIRARFLYREGFEFIPKFTLWLVANHAPYVDDLDDALWRRMIRIPFEHVIPEDRRDPGLKLRLKTDPAIQAAILRWIVDGCLNWHDVGLEVPESIRAATERYREDQNPLGDFITDRCITGAGYQAGAGELRAAYLSFAGEVGLKKTLSPRSWAERLRSMGFTEGRMTGGNRIWSGIGLR